MEFKLDKTDIEILRLLQKNCKSSAKEMTRKIGSPITTVYSKIRRMEELGIIKTYNAVLDGKFVDKGTTAFIMISFEYRVPGEEKPISQTETAEKIARFPEVQEVHIIAGDWDIIIKVKAKDVEDLGKFVTERLRKLEGIEKTRSCIVYNAVKESTYIEL